MGIDFSVRHNVEAMFAHRQATLNNTSLTRALERLSSGYRINRASDDAAGLAVSEKLRTQVRGFQMASRNIQDAMSLIQVAESGLQELTNILQRVRELSIQSANGIFTNSDRVLIQMEVDQLMNEVNRMMTSIEFNEQSLLDGTFSSVAPGAPRGVSVAMVKAGDQRYTNIDYNVNAFGDAGVTLNPPPGIQLPTGSTYQGSILFHVGANAAQTYTVHIATISAESLGLTSLFSSAGAVVGAYNKPRRNDEAGTTANGAIVRAKGILTQAFAQSAIAALDSAINQVSVRRSNLGALANRLEHQFNFAGVAMENLQAAESRIRDTDMAAEVIEFTKAQVLVQASNAMLAQANLKPTSILTLLG